MKKYLILVVIFVLSLEFISILSFSAEGTDGKLLDPAIAPEGFILQPVMEVTSGNDILIVQDMLTWGMPISGHAGACEQLVIPYDLITA